MTAVDSERTIIALGKIEGMPFEKFVNDFYSALMGRDYVPLGGIKDGGADGYEIYLSSDAAGKSFLQASIRMDVETKVRQTITRLEEVKRIPTSLTYICSKPIKSLDQIEDALTDELDVTVKIRDGNYISSHINDNDGTQAAYFKHLHHLTESLNRIGASNLVAASTHVRDPSAFVFLANEVERRGGEHTLVSSVIDSLVLWSLEGTDPERDILMTEIDILHKITGLLPSVESLVKPRLRKRLEALVARKAGADRSIRFYKKRDMFCLPFETRAALVAENLDDELLKTQIEASIEERIQRVRREGLGEERSKTAARATLRALQITFEKQGLAFTSSLHNGEDNELVVVTDSISHALDELSVNGKARDIVGAAVYDCLRGVLYESTQEERLYLHKLSRTYALLLTLNIEPKLITFFQKMAGDFYLYVGADQLVKALSERYLPEADQVVGNTLKMAARVGARLILTEPALSEVVFNLRTSDREFKNHFAPIENHITYDVARNSPKILVRAYMYARLGLSSRAKPSSWQAFVNQFCAYEDLHRNEAFDSIRRYLLGEYSMSYRDSRELHEFVQDDAFGKLAESLRDDKNEALADNDALMVLAVYGHRRRKRESSSPSEFGYQTWWLTSESRVLNHTKDLVDENNGVKYIMRPEFLLNFLTLAPAAAAARETFSSIFPSLLGVTLARRMTDVPFKKILKQISVATELNDSRRAAAMARLSDQLKSDVERQFLSHDELGQELTGIDAVTARAISMELTE